MAERIQCTLPQLESAAALNIGKAVFRSADRVSSLASESTNLKVLVIRANIPDQPAVTVTKEEILDLFNRPDGVRDFYRRASYGKVDLILTEADVPEAITMPGPSTTYWPGSKAFMLYAYDALRTTNPRENYDRWVFIHPRMDVNIGGAFTTGEITINDRAGWIFSVVAHEVGHTFSFGHAGRWVPRGSSPVSEGSEEEYGDFLDVMGSGQSTNNDINPIFKIKAGWIPSNNVIQVTNSGIYRLFRFDNANALQGEHDKALVLRLAHNQTRHFWISYRKTPYPLQSGAYILWNYDDYLDPGIFPTYLLDLNEDGGPDPLLRVGQSFQDPDTGIRFSIRGEGGEAPFEYLDVEVDMGSTVSLREALDLENLSFPITTGGEQPWVGTTVGSFDGTDACRSGIIEARQSSSLKIAVTGPGVLSFAWKVSSEPIDDYLSVILDSKEDGRISGEWSWQRRFVRIPEGTHEIEWRYTKSGRINRGGDCAWIDNVQFEPKPQAIAQAIRFELPEIPAGPPPPAFSDPVILYAEASSGLPVSLSVISGPAILSGSVLCPIGEGPVVVRATQPGDDLYAPATPVDRTMLVRAAQPLTALAADRPELNVGIGGRYGQKVRCMALQPDGKLIIGGYFETVAGTERLHLARFNSDGTLDREWHPRVVTSTVDNGTGILDMVIADNYLYVCGVFDGINNFPRQNVAKISLLDQGSLEAAWAPQQIGFVEGIESCDDGLLVHGPSIGLRKLSFDTAALSTEWDPAPNGSVWAMSVYQDELYVAGPFTAFNGGRVEKKFLAKISTRGGGTLDATWTSSGDYRGVTRIFLKATEQGLFAGGEWGSFSNGNSFAHFSRADGRTLRLDYPFQNLYAIEVHDGNIYVAYGASVSMYQSAAKEYKFFMRRLDSNTYVLDAAWQAHLSSRLFDFYLGGAVNAIVFNGNDMYVGGDFVSAGASAGAGLALIPGLDGSPVVSGAITVTDRQTTSGLIISPYPLDLAETSYYRVSNVQYGMVFKADKVTPVWDGDFITREEGEQGLTFRPSTGFSGEASFDVQAAIRPIMASLGNAKSTAVVTVSSTRLVQEIEFETIPEIRFVPGGTNMVQLNARASSGLPIRYLVTSGTATVDGDKVYLGAPGSVTVEAMQDGDSLYQAAREVTRSFTVQKALQQIEFPFIQTVKYATGPTKIDAKASSGLPVMFDFVTGPAVLVPEGLLTTGTGTVLLQATQPGNQVYERAQGSILISVLKGDQVIDFPPLPDLPYPNATVPLQAVSSAGLPVSFEVIGGAGVIQEGLLTASAPGIITIRATQAGNENYNPAASVERSLSIGRFPQSITFSFPAELRFQTSPIELAVSSSSGLPVSLEIISGPAAIEGSKLVTTGVGIATVRATQTGNDRYQPAVSEEELKIVKALQSISFLSQRLIPANRTTILKAAASSGLPVAFSILSGPAILEGATLFPSGTENIVVRMAQAGNDLFEASTNLDVELFVVPTPPNDHFSNSRNVPAVDGVSIQDNNISATTEVGERELSADASGSTLWYTWEALVPGVLRVSSKDSAILTVLAAYTGESISQLTPVVTNGENALDETAFFVTAGKVYHVAVDGRESATGTINLAFTFKQTTPEIRWTRSPSAGTLTFIWPEELRDYQLEVSSGLEGPWRQAITSTNGPASMQVFIHPSEKCSFFRMRNLH